MVAALIMCCASESVYSLLNKRCSQDPQGPTITIDVPEPNDVAEPNELKIHAEADVRDDTSTEAPCSNGDEKAPAWIRDFELDSNPALAMHSAV